ncbi:DUF4979 domain-containing protein [Flavobacterium sp. CF136]|uniref:DUF4979 domain-containing protein n=1 Tax=Flavobacterium sp. (strain CF136) TaxID=1144313 RepID=UPI0002719F75|nr:DUF4979 domain-containing protein [Flavobacterium sp. CF136]EJL63671.1 Alginate lyase Sialidase, N-terminal domain-containing protein [Flavobacterium sp. CF136]
MKKLTLLNFPKPTAASYKRPSKPIYHRLFYLMILFIPFIKTQAQTGLINDDFSTGSTFNWIAATSGSTGQIQNGKFLVTFPPPSAGKYRADLKKNGGITFHAGNYPIIAIKINKPPRCNYFFDTNLGSYNGTNNNGTKIVTDTGNVYYWDLSTGKLGSTTLSTTQATTLSLFQIKIAEIVLTDAEIAANKTNYSVDWVKSFASVDALRTFLNPSGNTNPQFEFSGTFVHPGLLHGTDDLNRIKDLVDRQVTRPYQSYQQLLVSGKSTETYTMRGPYSSLTRDASLTIDGTAGGTVKNNVESDFLAAYQNALMYKITGNEAHALKAIEILDAYSATTQSIVGSDAELNGLYGFMLVNAAEIMRSIYPAWPANKILQCQNMLKNVFYPVIGNFKPCAHGNWDIICMKALMGIAIFTEDTAMFNKTVNYYYYGEGNGSIKNYVITDAGQLQESNRDQPHTMLAIGSLAELAEMALKQGVDLYATNNNAIMRGYEYTSQYNLGLDVPYQTSYDYCEKNYADYTPTAISSTGRGAFRAVFEIAYNHYVYRKGIAMPQTKAVLGQMGPEGAPFGADNPGYGSLFFYLNTANDYTFSNLGLIDNNFTNTTDVWNAVTAGSVATSENGQLKVTTVLQSNGKGRGDIKKGTTISVHAGNFPILAIKIKKPVTCSFIFDTNLGSYGNGANKWTGKVGEDIYYYDLTTTGFGATPTMLSTTDATSLTTFQFKVADITSGETNYQVDWVKTVQTVAELQAFVAPSYQTISFPAITTLKVGDPDFGEAVSSSGLTATYSSSDQSVATIVNGKIHIVGAGTSEITATQAGDANYYPADAVKQNLTVVKNDQTISFNALSSKIIGDSDFDPGAIASSGLAVTYTSSDESIASIVNGKIHILASGTSTITASQAGNNVYGPAALQTQVLTVYAIANNVKAAAGDAKNIIEWDPILNYSYNIKRSATSGGTYTIVGTITGTKFTDTAVTNGNTYYYVVSVISSLGENPNSAEVIAQPNTGQISYLKFDEQTGSQAIDSWGANHGALQATATRAAGHSGLALKLDGTASSYATLPTGIVSTLSNFTISAWVKMDALANWMRVFDFGTGTNKYMFLSVQAGSANVMRYAIKNGGAEKQVSFNYVLPLNTWTYFAVTQSGNTCTLYINGTAVASNTAVSIKPSNIGSTNQNYLGKSQFNDPMFKGAIDGFKIYSRALSAQEITEESLSTLKTVNNKPDGLIDNVVLKNTVIYPNPIVNNRFTVSTNTELIGKEVQVKLINLAGQTIYLKSVKNDTGNIDIVLNQILPGDIYVLFLNNQYSGKVIVKQ